MIELCASPLFPALFFWAVFAVVLSLPSKVCSLLSPPASAPPLGDIDANNPPCPRFLAEVVRLAEERMREMLSASVAYERKATLLATLCLLTLGYLLPNLFGDEPTFSKGSPWVHIAVWSLVLSVLCCVRAVNFASYGPLGLHPIVTSGIMAAPTEKSLFLTHNHLLKEYGKRIDKNNAANSRKYKSLIVAMVFWTIGTGASLGLIVHEMGFFVHCLH